MDYAKITEITLTEIKTIRKSVIEENWQRELATARASSYFDFGGFELTEYDGIVNQCKLVSYKMVINIVLSLFEKKGIRASYIYDEEDSMDCIIAPHYDKNVIYIFHEFMKVATWNPETKKRFENNYNVDYCIGVSFVRTGANSVVFNHTDNIKNPMRGTNQLSFRDFFLFYFGTDEYSRFESAMKQFEKNARDAIGMRVVKTLHPAAMHYYKRILNLRFKKMLKNVKSVFRHRWIHNKLVVWKINF